MYMYACICMYMCVYVCVYVCVCICMCVCMCMCVYAYMYMYVCIIYWGIVRGKCLSQNGRGNCPGELSGRGIVQGGIVLHPLQLHKSTFCIIHSQDFTLFSIIFYAFPLSSSKFTTTTAQFPFYNCKLHFTTAQIVISCTLKYALLKTSLIKSNRNLGVSSAPLKSQAHQRPGTSLFTSVSTEALSSSSELSLLTYRRSFLEM